MTEEYEALRAEMLEWQNRRFTILTVTITLVVGILGLEGVLTGESTLGWWLVASLLWFFLGSSAALTWYAGRANAKAAAYIIVFYEAKSSGWETRLDVLKKSKLDWFSLNRMVVLIYFGLAVLSFLVPWTVRESQCVIDWQAYVLVVSGAWITGNLLLLLRDKPKVFYIQSFRDIFERSENLN